METVPAGVGAAEVPMPTGARKITLPARNNVAVRRARSITKRVSTNDQPPSALRGSQPSVPLGRTARLTRTQIVPRATRSPSAPTRGVVPAGVGEGTMPTAALAELGGLRPTVARSTAAQRVTWVASVNGTSRP